MSSDPKQVRVFLITGCSSGLGFAMAQYFLEQGQKVAVTARNINKIKHFEVSYPNSAVAITLDVTDTQSVHLAVKQTMESFNRIDVLINNAGYGQTGELEILSDKEIHEQMETNFFGVIRLTQSLIPIMRAQNSGHIIQISSIAGRMAFPGVSLYCASKFAIEGLSEALSKEISGYNIHTTIVEPGSFKTEFFNSAPHQQHANYPQLVSAQIKGREIGDPMKAAAAIHRIIESPKPPLRLLLGSDAVKLVTAQLNEQITEIEQWKEISLSTDKDTPKI